MKKKEPKGKRKSQMAKTVIEKNHTKTHPVLIFPIPTQKGTLRNKGCVHKKEQQSRT